ncbi:MAG: chemotaxis protein CheA [Sphingomonadales bacterium]|nr:MAG: chemotaxis protein CheA [Sphingomonadales bacterium]TNF02534.1 MAG: chemotaxis protein CheA [Sphingomonadales bacterium]
MDELLTEFVAETQESLEALTTVVVALEADPSDGALLDELFRFFHTVKGSCSFLNLPRFEKLSHAAEDVLSDIRAGDNAADAATISAVLAVMDRIAELCSAVEMGESLPDRDDEQLIQALRRSHEIARGGSREEAEAGIAVAEEVDVPGLHADPAPRMATTARTVRLPLTLIDQLMNGVSDMVLARNELARKLRAGDGDPETQAAFDRLSACIADMRDTISKTRMQRVDRLFMAIPRMVRDLGRDLGKVIDLVIEGGEVEMDREMVEMVVDPLTHLVRNSIDHGIETPEQRRAEGKAEAGSLRLSAYQSGSQIVIEVADDGRGIDLDAVVAKVVSTGLMSAKDVAGLSDQAKLDLIFTPGLSTAGAVTAVSGRGVGMDIVRANIERIGGVISLANDPGQGLTISMRVPLTLTIIPGLILNAGGLHFAIPRPAVIEILHDNNPAVAIMRLGGGLTATIRGIRYSMIDLESVIGLPVLEQGGPRTLVLVRSASGVPYILGVAQVDNHEELVVRPAAPMVMAAGIYAGMTLPDNGQPMLLLDAGGIAQVAQLPLIVEHVEPEVSADDTEEEGPDTHYEGLRFVELTGEERIIRLSLVDRVEDIPIERCSGSGGCCRALVGDKLVRSVREIGPDMLSPGTRHVTCLRIRDGQHELCYPVRSVLDIDRVPVELAMVARQDLVAGLVLIDGREVEVIDSLALLARASGERPPEEDDRPVRCIIMDGEDPWNREILAPLLVEAGYPIQWGKEGHAIGPDDIVLLTGQDEEDDAAGTEAPVIRLRALSVPAGPDDASIYRYDREALLGAIAMVREERQRA